MYQKIKEILLRLKFFQFIRTKILALIYYKQDNEIVKHCGSKNPDKTFFVIRNYTKEAGFGSILNYILLNIEYAEEKGWIPIVDMQNYPNIYLNESEIGKVNAWEKFFYQLYDISLDEVYKSSNVILCSSELRNRGYVGYGNKEEIQKYHKLYLKYIKPLPGVAKAIEQEYQRVFGESEKTLGVLCRGTDYVNLKPSKHAIPLNEIETCEKVNQIINDFEIVYMATEDDSIMEYAKANVDNEKLRYTEQKRFNQNRISGYLADNIKDDKVDRYRMGLDYLKVIYMLSKCNSLMSPCVGGSAIAYCINGGNYETFGELVKGTYE